MIGIIILALNTGTMRISEILYQATHDYPAIKNVAFVAGVLLFIGARVKVHSFHYMSGYLMQWLAQLQFQH